jgi:hypothetical protein
MTVMAISVKSLMIVIALATYIGTIIPCESYRYRYSKSWEHRAGALRIKQDTKIITFSC